MDRHGRRAGGERPCRRSKRAGPTTSSSSTSRPSATRRSAWPGGRPGQEPFEEALDAARAADVVVFVGGLTAEVEGEEMPVSYPGFKGGDRTDIELPALQKKMLEALHATGKPVVLVS